MQQQYGREYKQACDEAKNVTDRVYRYRDAILKKNGYHGYIEYLSSDHWKMVKSYVKEKWCHCCGSFDNLNMHHKNYTKVMMASPRKAASIVVAVCSNCHNEIHRLVKVSEHGLMIRGAEAKLRRINNFNTEEFKKNIDNTHY